MSEGAPSLAIALLRWAIGMEASAQGIIGDLLEEYGDRCARTGPWAAGRWFWGQALWIGLVFRLRGGGLRSHAAGSGGSGNGWWRDLAHAARSLGRAPGFTALVVLILAGTIGTTATMASVFHGVVLRGLPVTDADGIVTIALNRESGGSLPLLPPEVEVMGLESRTLAAVAGVSSSGAAALPLTEGDRSLVMNMTMVTANFFDVINVSPSLGRRLRVVDGDIDGTQVAMISYRAWQRDFGGSVDVLERELTTTHDQTSYQIVGVAPPGLDYPVGTDFWALRFPRRQMNIVARLAPDATPELAATELRSIALTFERLRSDSPVPLVVSVGTLEEAVVGDIRPIFTATAAGVALLLLIACVNVGNLLLMRAGRRSREILVRRALGAGYGGVARLFFAESVLLGVVGGGLGLVLALWLLQLLPSMAPPGFPRTDMISVGSSPVVAAGTVTLLALSLFGVLPALAAARGDLASALRVDVRSGSGTRRRRLTQRWLVGSQVALAVVLLVGAGLLTRSFQQLAQLDMGYETEGLTIVEVGVPFSNYRGSAMGGMFEEVFERLRAVPGVTALSPVMSRPFIGSLGVLEVRPIPERAAEFDSESYPNTALEIGGPEYFDALRIPILQGRGFNSGDRADAAKIAVVSRDVAARLWPGEDPIGKRVRLIRDDWWTVVGVAADARFRGLREATPTIYLPWRQLQVIPAAVTVAVRAEGDGTSLTPVMRQAVQDFDPDMYIWRAVTMRDHLVLGPLGGPRMSAAVFSGFGLIALLLAAMGLYGVMAMAVRERSHEIGVRRTLGASSIRLRRDVLRDALAVTAAGGLIGLVGAVPATRLLENLLFDVRPVDPATLLGVCALLAVVALAAAWVPVQRATRIDPIAVLRTD